MHSPFGHNRHRPKMGGCAPFWWKSSIPSNTKSLGPRTTSVSSGILIHPTVWPQRTLAENWGWLCPLFGDELGPPLIQSRLAKAYLHTKWHLNPSSRLATTDMGRKVGLCPFGGAGSRSNTMCPGPRPNCMSSFILIRSTVWPQYTKVADRTRHTHRQTTVR